MTARELARQLKTPYTTVAGWLQNGKVPGAKAQVIGAFRVWMIPVGVLDTVNEWRPKPGRPIKAAGRKTGAKKAAKKPGAKKKGGAAK